MVACTCDKALERLVLESVRLRRWHYTHVEPSIYDPVATFTRSEVLQLIEETEKTIKQFELTTTGDRRAFAIYVLLRFRNY